MLALQLFIFVAKQLIVSISKHQLSEIFLLDSAFISINQHFQNALGVEDVLWNWQETNISLAGCQWNCQVVPVDRIQY
jgi:hypothetical protein